MEKTHESEKGNDREITTAKEQERLGANRDIQATNRIILNSITGAPR